MATIVVIRLKSGMAPVEPKVCYSGIHVSKYEHSKMRNLFRVSESHEHTEKLYRIGEDPMIRYIQITRQKAGELATLPPPRTGTMFLVTDYRVVKNLILEKLASGDSGTMCLHIGDLMEDDGFFGVVQACDQFVGSFQNKIQSGDTPVTSLYEVYDASGVRITDRDTLQEKGLILPADVKTLEDVLATMNEIEPKPRIVIDIHGGYDPSSDYPNDTLKLGGRNKNTSQNQSQAPTSKPMTDSVPTASPDVGAAAAPAAAPVS